jgi:hypothetical protein
LAPISSVDLSSGKDYPVAAGKSTMMPITQNFDDKDADCLECFGLDSEIYLPSLTIKFNVT